MPVYKIFDKENDRKVIEQNKERLLSDGRGKESLDQFHAYYHWDLDNDCPMKDEDGSLTYSIMSDNYIVKMAKLGRPFWIDG